MAYHLNAARPEKQVIQGLWVLSRWISQRYGNILRPSSTNNDGQLL